MLMPVVLAKGAAAHDVRIGAIVVPIALAKGTIQRDALRAMTSCWRTRLRAHLSALRCTLRGRNAGARPAVAGSPSVALLLLDPLPLVTPRIHSLLGLWHPMACLLAVIAGRSLSLPLSAQPTPRLAPAAARPASAPVLPTLRFAPAAARPAAPPGPNL